MNPPPLESERTLPSGNNKIWGILSHLSALLGVGLVLPLVVYLAMKGDSDYVRENAGKPSIFTSPSSSIACAASR
jgi:uncharacterized Tic20 family protein